MADKYYDIRVDVGKGQVINSGYTFTKGDSNKQLLRIKVMDGPNVFDDTGASRVTIAFKKRDGNIVTGTPTKTAEGYVWRLLGTEVSCPGQVICDIKFSYASGRVSSGKFSYNVESDTLDGTARAAGSYITEFEEIMEELKSGRSISSIDYTSTTGRVDTYTITYSDGTTSTFTVTNGETGPQGIKGDPGKAGTIKSVTAVAGNTANVVNAGTDTEAELRFTLPKGDKGDAYEITDDDKEEIAIMAAALNPRLIRFRVEDENLVIYHQEELAGKWEINNDGQLVYEFKYTGMYETGSSFDIGADDENEREDDEEELPVD